MLTTPLGDWTTNNESRLHTAYFDHEDQSLWLPHEKNWYRHPLKQRHRRYFTFHLATPHLKAQKPPKAVPIDITKMGHNCIKTTTAAAMRDTAPPASQHVIWYQRSSEKHNHMTGNISLLVDDNDLTSLFQDKAHIEIPSDGGHDPQSGISTFGWAVAVDNLLIAKGRGPAQAHSRLAESFRAEGYGLSSALLFIQNLTSAFNISPPAHEWTIYIDNMALIQRLDGYTLHVPIPRWNLRSDEDITRTAFNLLNKIPAKKVHVHSHQDENTEWTSLSFPAQMNTTADEQASFNRMLMDTPEIDVINLARAQLRIDNTAITRDSQRELLHAAGKIPLQEYYQHKWGWNTNIIESISWVTQQKALKHFNTSYQTRILKFVHGWLPTQSRQFKEGAATLPKCKICPELYENNLHLLRCQHPDMRQLLDDGDLFLTKQHQDHGDSELLNILQLALAESAHNSNWNPSLAATSVAWRPAIEEQSSIGWIHLYMGRISQQLIEQMEDHYRSLNLNTKQYTGERWARKFIINIWDLVLRLWKQRNELIFDKENQRQTSAMRDKLEARVTRCYALKDKLAFNDRHIWFDI
jgi:hypothetical protein